MQSTAPRLSYATRGEPVADRQQDCRRHGGGQLCQRSAGVRTLSLRTTQKSGTGVTATFFVSSGSDGEAEEAIVRQRNRPPNAEYNSSGTPVSRTVPGPAIDEPIAQVSAAGATTYFHINKQGSVIAMSNTAAGRAEGALYLRPPTAIASPAPPPRPASQASPSASRAGGSTPRPGCSTTAPATTPPRSAASCRPIRWGMRQISISMPMSEMIRRIGPIRQECVQM